jgi:Secretion system C-terminal sorting domain
LNDVRKKHIFVKYKTNSMKKILLFIGSVSLLNTAMAQWNADPTVNTLVVGTVAKGTTSVSNMVNASDGSGGMFIAWTDARNSAATGNDLFIIRILENGSVAPGFLAGGNIVSNAAGNQSNVALVEDGAGGVIITWQDPANGNDIMAQRVGANGSLLWGSEKTVATGANSQNTPGIVKVNNERVAIVWRYTGTSTSTDIAANYLSIADGSKILASDVVVVEAANAQSNQSIVADGNEGVIIVWTDARVASNAAGIRAERLNNSGTKLWGESTGGLVVRAEGGSNTTGPAIETDGAGGAVIAWSDSRNGGANADLYVQRVSASGNLEWGSLAILASSAAPVPAGNGQQMIPVVAKSGSQFIVAWNDQRNTALNIDLYAQAFDINGEKLWGSGGEPIAIITEKFNQPASTTTQPVVLPDGSGGAFFVWDDRRLMVDNPSPTPDIIEEDIYAQKVNATGMLAWNISGVPVATLFGSNQNSPVVVSSTDNTYMISWRDSRSGNANAEIYASLLKNDGVLPLNFIDITAKIAGKNVLVSWINKNEKAVSHFIIERSLNGIDFAAAGKVDARNATGTHNYSYEDVNQAGEGTRYYRVKGVDIDGSTTYSKIAKLLMADNPNQKLMVFPNPATATVTLTLPINQPGNYVIRMIDASGRIFQVSPFNINTLGQNFQVPVANLSRGLYKIQVLNNKGEILGINSFIKQ